MQDRPSKDPEKGNRWKHIDGVDWERPKSRKARIVGWLAIPIVVLAALVLALVIDRLR